jgi:hypothetical protein
VADQGDPKRVVDAYLTYVAGGEEALMAAEHGHGAPGSAEAAAEAAPAETADGGYRQGRWGSREVEIAAVRILDESGRERHVFAHGESLTVELEVKAARPADDFVFGVGLFTADGVSVYGTNTHLEDFLPRRAEGTGRVGLVLQDLRLVEGTYLLDVAVHKRDGTPFDYHRGLYSFRIKSRVKDVGVYRPEHRWTFAGGVELTPPKPRAELSLGDLAGEDGE